MTVGLLFPPATTFTSQLYEQQGGSLGILTASGTVAGLANPAVGGIVGTRYGWRPAMVVDAVVALPMLLATI